VKTHIKTGDTVMVIAGDSKSKTGVVKSVDREKNRALVEGLNLVTKHVKPSTQDPQAAGLVKIESPIHLSNLMLVEPATGKPTRIGRKLNEKGKLQRFSKTTQKFI
jgi:large subunit ribosomal protein L24